MKNTCFFLVQTLSFLNLCAQCADTANIYSFNFEGKKYEIVMEKRNWATAAACAVTRGGYLVQISSKSEQDSIYNTIINTAGISSNYTIVNDGGGVAYVWIGATDKKNEGVWLWDGNNDNIGINFWNGKGGSGGGSVVAGAYNNWGGSSLGGEPDDFSSQQDAAAIALASWPYGDAGEWNDIKSSNNLYYVIEYDSSITTGIKNAINGNRITAYPNPTNGVITIKFCDPICTDGTLLAIYDLLGNQVFYTLIALNSNELLIDLSDKDQGMYFIKINDENCKMCKSIIIQ